MINIVYRLKSPKFFEESIDNLNLDNVIVRPKYLSICKADQRYYQGSRPPKILLQKLPMALIHEGVGEVVYDKNNHFNVGDNVVMIPNTPQEKDSYKANYSRTSKFRGSGFDGFTSELVGLKSDRLVKIPDNFNLKVSSFICSKSLIAILLFSSVCNLLYSAKSFSLLLLSIISFLSLSSNKANFLYEVKGSILYMHFFLIFLI